MKPAFSIDAHVSLRSLALTVCERRLTLFLLILRAYLMVLSFELYVLRDDFPSLHERVRKRNVAHAEPSFGPVERMIRAVDLACVWYPKQVLCLQRSAATTCLLRRFGFPAQLVIGTQSLPFKAHAWVEVKGTIVNDKSYLREMYTALDRC